MRITKGAAVAACFCMLVSSATTTYAGGIQDEIIKTEAIPSVERTTGYPKPDIALQPTAYGDIIEDYAEEYGVPVDLAHAIIKVESNYTQGAVSHAGALGLAQLMPGTADYLRVDPADPIENLDGGARYLLEQMAEFGSLELALAAYNAGPEAVRKYDGIPPFDETQSHIVKVMAAYDRILADL